MKSIGKGKRKEGEKEFIDIPHDTKEREEQFKKIIRDFSADLSLLETKFPAAKEDEQRSMLTQLRTKYNTPQRYNAKQYQPKRLKDSSINMK